MDESLLQSFNNLMHQQTKMDYKAYIFMGFSAVVYNILSKQNSIYISVAFFLLITPLFLSLLPTLSTNSIIKIIEKVQNKKKESHNIFYYLDIYNLSNEEFIQILKDEYDIAEVTKSESKLINIIIINAKILNAKMFWHARFKNILGLIVFFTIIKVIIEII